MKKETISTYSDKEVKPLSLEELKKATSKIMVGSSGKGKKKNIFERFMNKLGWYRSSEWYLLDSSKFFPMWGWQNKESNIKESKK